MTADPSVTVHVQGPLPGLSPGLVQRAPVGVWHPHCSLTVPQLRMAPYPGPLYLPVGGLHLGLQLLEERPPSGGCWVGRGLARPWSALGGAGVPRGEAAICRALGKGHGDKGLAPPAGCGALPHSAVQGPAEGQLSGQLWMWSPQGPCYSSPCSSLRGLMAPRSSKVPVFPSSPSPSHSPYLKS